MRGSWKQVAIVAALLWGGIVTARSAGAQVLGIAALLNPEGSRLFPGSLVYPRHAGKPDPRWRTFDWSYADLNLSDAPLRLYFYNEESWAAQYVVPELRAEIQELRTIFNYIPKQRFTYLLFSSHRDFAQTNVFNISEEVQGVTSTQEATMAIPYWGQRETYRHISYRCTP